jgi:hypothetical protein
MAEPEDIIAKLLPGKLSQTRRQEVAESILDELADAGYLFLDTVSSVEIPGARVTVETIQAYGLTIEIDANGDAGKITSLRGLEVVE